MGRGCDPAPAVPTTIVVIGHGPATTTGTFGCNAAAATTFAGFHATSAATSACNAGSLIMMNAIRAEWIKLRTIRSTWVLLFVAIALTVGFAILLGFVASSDGGGRRGDGGPGPTVQTTLVGFAIATLLVGVVSVLLATGDFRFTIRQTLAAEPRRLRVMAAKAIVVTLASAIIGAVMIALAVGIGSLIFKSRDLSLNFKDDGWSTIIGSLLYLILYSLAGLAIGLLVRHSAGAIVLLLVWPLLVEPIVGALSRNYFSWMLRWLPFSAGSRMTSFSDDTLLLGRWTGGLYFGAWVAALLVLGSYLLKRRDA
jgi:ABC-2 type transport system permease protein